MTDKLSVADVLDRAATLIEPEGAWCQDPFAQNADGTQNDDRQSGHPGAVAFCAVGALSRICGGYTQLRQDAKHAVDQQCEDNYYSIIEFNGQRTQSEVVSKLREAANLARERGL